MINNLFAFFIQGIFEAFPISSSMHLLFLAPNFSKLDAFMHLGTFLAFSAFFRKFIIKCIKSLNEKLTQKIIINSLILILPTIILGKFIKSREIEKTYVIFINFSASIFMYICNLQKREKSLISLKTYECSIMGLFLPLAFIPGVSRLGITFSILRLFKLRLFDSIFNAILLGIPITGGAAFLGIKKLLEIKSEIGSIIELAGLTILSGILTYSTVILTFKLRNYWWIYVLYRVCVSILLFCYYY